jgi:cellulose synthase/poly-beta-1,6-N-acetylglucosamine synthase-like glycosyltransferase
MVTRTELAVVAIYYAVMLLLIVYALHRLHLVRLLRRLGNPSPACFAETGERWPAVAVQLPLYNEPNVAARLIDAAAALEYDGRLEIQVLDDSTDGTSTIVRDRLAAARVRGVKASHVRRATRDGYKAGALAEGLARTDAEILVIFDADFLPAPQVLKRIVAAFRDPAVGMVQARWGHLNRHESTLTRVQALYLDGHFGVESAARYLDGRFFNFNGTAGAWRKQAILDAGGWSAATLTEDLDLSYRAQLAGWKFVFLPGVEVPAELPSTLSGFEGQQHRWARGSIQTARAILGAVAAARLPFKIKLEAFFHLTSNVAYLLMLLLALLLVPAMEIRYRSGWAPFALVDLLVLALSSWSLIAFCMEGQRRVGRLPRWLDIACLVPLGIGISVNNATAVLEGLWLRGGEFRRTPKRGMGSHRDADSRPPRFPLAEIALTLFFVSAAAIFLATGRWMGLPFLLLFLGGYGYAVFLSAREWRVYRRGSYM